MQTLPQQSSPFMLWFTDERRMWLAGIFGALVLGAAFSNGAATQTQTAGCYDKLYHSEVQTKALKALPATPAPPKSP